MIFPSRVIRGSRTVRLDSGIVVNLPGSGSGSGGAGTSWTCDASVSLYDVVAISADDTVAKADPATLNTNPAIGIVSAKITDTECSVQYINDIEIVRSPVFVNNRIYYAGPNGTLVCEAEGSLPARLQIIGRGKTSNILVLTLGSVMTFPA